MGEKACSARLVIILAVFAVGALHCGTIGECTVENDLGLAVNLINSDKGFVELLVVAILDEFLPEFGIVDIIAHAGAVLSASANDLTLFIFLRGFVVVRMVVSVWVDEDGIRWPVSRIVRQASSNSVGLYVSRWCVLTSIVGDLSTTTVVRVAGEVGLRASALRRETTRVGGSEGVGIVAANRSVFFCMFDGLPWLDIRRIVPCSTVTFAVAAFAATFAALPTLTALAAASTTATTSSTSTTLPELF